MSDLQRQACIRALVAMLVSGRLSEDEFELRWNQALGAVTMAELRVLRHEADGDDDDTEGEGV